MIAKFTLQSLIYNKMFLGAIKQHFNPQTEAYVEGLRHHIHVMNLIQSNFRLRKFLSLVEMSSARRVPVLIVLRKGWRFGRLLQPWAYYVQSYIPGVLSNMPAVLRALDKKQLSYYVPTYPGLICAFPHYARVTDAVLGEARQTRTPSAFIFDSGMNPHPGNYGINGCLEYGSARFIALLIAQAAKQGQLRERNTFAKIFRFAFESVVKSFSTQLLTQINSGDTFLSTFKLGLLSYQQRTTALKELAEWFTTNSLIKGKTHYLPHTQHMYLLVDKSIRSTLAKFIDLGYLKYFMHNLKTFSNTFIRKLQDPLFNDIQIKQKRFNRWMRFTIMYFLYFSRNKFSVKSVNRKFLISFSKIWHE